ncbi:MAG: hypothetical protein ACTSX6_08195 [Candidatus Heimdallarchaeaceae archaeon]
MDWRTSFSRRRATNPENYNADGTVKKGPKHWNKSQGYQDLRTKLAEADRRLAETRKRSQGQLANEVISLGNVIKTEKLSYKGFQRRWGKAVGSRAPGMFLSMIRRKAESAGGEIVEFPTQSTKLSQTCHCGNTRKKTLSVRWHNCACGVGPVQRDLYSGFLARFVEGKRLDTLQAANAWTGAKPLLGRAVSRLNETAKGNDRLAGFGLSRRQSGLHVKDGSAGTDAGDDVQATVFDLESPEEVVGLAVRTPWL